ncbi:MAG: MarR family winged helix-turn-helix transcriptional regulator, partial [Advenella sp.]
LRVEFDCTLPRFDLMAQLAKEPDGMRMGELSARLMVSNGNVTTIANQLEKEGLILRKVSSEDRRSTFLRLSAKGRRQFEKMAAAHEAWLQQMFSGLPGGNQKKLYNLLAELKQAALTSQA